LNLVNQTIANYTVLASWAAFVLLLSITYVRSRKLETEASARRSASDRAMPGLLLQFVGASIAMWGSGGIEHAWRLWAGSLLAPASALFAWRASVELGRQFRVKAVVTEDHELITTGPYSIVRHPIYAAILGLVMAVGLVRTPWPRLAFGALLFCIGTEIRIRVEESLLRERFAAALEQYRRRVKAYIPLVR
jgi:protein-S-isoprenylcysteine O-methyltransferase Ste14